MLIKKSAGKIFGADLTASERKAMEMEIKRQMAEYDRKNIMEIDALILWELHEQLGFGEKRLKQFYDAFNERFYELIRRYEMEDSDGVWLCTKKLKDLGIDLEAWEKESMA